LVLPTGNAASGPAFAAGLFSPPPALNGPLTVFGTNETAVNDLDILNQAVSLAVSVESGPYKKLCSRSQSYDFCCIYSYNANVVVGLSVFTSEKNNFYYKTHHAISCAVKFYNAGVLTQGRRIGS
jgi:hypothetical protein